MFGIKQDKNDTLPRDELQNGPLNNRGCTDVLCCLIFLAFLVGMVGTSGYGYLYGDPELLLTTWDYDGNGCGYSDLTVDYPYLYFPTINYTAAMEAEGSLTGGGSGDSEDDEETDYAAAATSTLVAVLKYGMCVRECPTKTSTVSCY